MPSSFLNTVQVRLSAPFFPELGTPSPKYSLHLARLRVPDLTIGFIGFLLYAWRKKWSGVTRGSRTLSAGSIILAYG